MKIILPNSFERPPTGICQYS